MKVNIVKKKPFTIVNGFTGASDGNRTHATSLEGWNSTIELHPHSIAALRFRWYELSATALIFYHNFLCLSTPFSKLFRFYEKESHVRFSKRVGNVTFFWFSKKRKRCVLGNIVRVVSEQRIERALCHIGVLLQGECHVFRFLLRIAKRGECESIHIVLCVLQHKKIFSGGCFFNVIAICSVVFTQIQKQKYFQILL